MQELKTGEVTELPAGFHVFHNQLDEVTVLQQPTVVVVENTRKIVPLAVTGAEGHFETCFMVKARVLNVDGTYHREGALLTFAQYGDFHPKYILPDNPNLVLRRMRHTFVND